MKVGMLVVPMHPFESYLDVVEAAAQDGVDSLWLPDHLLGCAHPVLWSDMALSAVSPDADAWYDPFVCVAAVGNKFDLPMGVAVTDGIRRRAPDIARTTLTLHHLCRGGFRLGLGAGEAESLVPFGYDFTSPVTKLEEFLVELRTLLTDGVMPAGHSGRLGLPLRRADVGAPEIWIGAHEPRMLRLAGEYGDGWIPAWPMEPSTYGQKRRIVAGHADRCGRPAPECAMQITAILGASREHIADLMEREPLAKLCTLMNSAQTWTEYGLTHPAGEQCRGLVDLIQHDLDPEELRELAPKIPFELVEELMFVGNATEVAERVGGYVDHGLEHVIVADITGIVGGLNEIEANAETRTSLLSALRALA
nr:LLM class flavin-dependent oxidoreductase [Mycolicibacterium komanii]CRL76978.1 F420-dependent methylene-tetrahydromethanopterin reductase [Mycolicibacterium komanii]